MKKASHIARAIREPGYHPPPPGAEVPVFMGLPTNVARTAVRRYHTNGAAFASNYIRGSKLGEWTSHSNPSMATNATNTIAGFDAYVAADQADGRAVADLDVVKVVALPSELVEVRFDAIVESSTGIGGRVVLWDGPDFSDDNVAVIAAPYALALSALFPNTTLTTIGIWQARRQHFVEVPVSEALTHLIETDQVLKNL